MSRDPAAPRYFLIIQSVRMAGVGGVVYALLVLRARAPWPEEAPLALAYVLLVIGLAGAFIVPRMLARRWRSGDR